MKKDAIVIKESTLIKLIYETVASRIKSKPIEFVRSVQGVSFVEYFDITPRDVKKAFFNSNGGVVCSFMGINHRKMKFNLLNELASNNLVAKEFHPCDFGTLELWMFFSDSKLYGDKSFYIALSLKSNGRDYNGHKATNIKYGDFIPTSRLSSDAISVMVVDLLVKLYDQVCGVNIKTNYMRGKKKKEGFFV